MTREKAFQRAPRVAVTNGDSVGGSLRVGHLADVVIAWQDVLHEGPVPSLTPARLRKLRAAYLASRYSMPPGKLEARLAARDTALRRHADEELTLWFEADLHDQLQLIQILPRLTGNSRLRMISIGEFPDRARFGGLGELSPQQLETLLPLARPVSAEGIELATKAWTAFTAPDPSGLMALSGVLSGELRYLGDAVIRFLQEYPGRSDGLSLSQRRILIAVERGMETFPVILRAHWEGEPRPFFGDLGYKAELRALTDAGRPALAESGGRYALTELGRQLLAGRADWIEANGVERWLGGVHLSGRDSAWRYDERLERLVKAP